jgi:hypothetical protein
MQKQREVFSQHKHDYINQQKEKYNLRLNFNIQIFALGMLVHL